MISAFGTARNRQRGAVKAPLWRVVAAFFVICAMISLPFQSSVGAHAASADATEHCISAGHHALQTAEPAHMHGDIAVATDSQTDDQSNGVPADDCVSCCSVCNVSVDLLGSGALDMRPALPTASAIVHPGGRSSEPSAEPPRTSS